MGEFQKSRSFDVFFEIYGKKLKTVIMAENEQQAKEIVKNKIIFHKVEKSKDAFNSSIDTMEDILDILDGKNKA